MTTGSPSAADEKLSLAALIALVIGSMVGAGIFTLPAKLGGASNGAGVLIAWVCCRGPWSCREASESRCGAPRAQVALIAPVGRV